MRLALLAALLVPTLAFGQGARRDVTPLNARYFTITTPIQTVAAGAPIANLLASAPADGRLVDVIVYQISAGTGGTSFTVDVKHPSGTSMLSTLPVITLASGADKVTDASGRLALPSGWTRPVVKTTADAQVTRGQRIQLATVETGTYSAHPTIFVALVIEPNR